MCGGGAQGARAAAPEAGGWLARARAPRVHEKPRHHPGDEREDLYLQVGHRLQCARQHRERVDRAQRQAIALRQGGGREGGWHLRAAHLHDRTGEGGGGRMRAPSCPAATQSRGWSERQRRPPRLQSRCTRASRRPCAPAASGWYLHACGARGAVAVRSTAQARCAARSPPARTPTHPSRTARRTR